MDSVRRLYSLLIFKILLLMLVNLSASPYGVAHAQRCSELFEPTSQTAVPSEFNDSRMERLWYLRENGTKAEATKLEQELRATLETGAITKITRTEANSETYEILFENGERAFFKPKQKRNYWVAEVAAYTLDQRLGVNMVPMTVERKIKKGFFTWAIEGSLQFAPPHVRPTQAISGRIGIFSKAAVTMTLFDYLLDNGDRSFNFLGVWQRILLIDNGDGLMNPVFVAPSKTLLEFIEKTHEPLRSKILGLTPEELRLILKDVGDPRVVEAAVQRLEAVQKVLSPPKESRLKKGRLSPSRNLSSP